MSSRYPSLDLVYEELTRLLDRQRAHAEAMDSKASIVLGFTALVLGAALTRPEGLVESSSVWVAILLAAGSFGFALAAFWVRSYKNLPNPRPFYEEFAGQQTEQTQLLLCNLAADAFEKNAPIIRGKALWLRLSSALLAGSVLAVLIAFYGGGT